MPYRAAPSLALPRHAGPRQTLMVSPPHSRLSLSGYRLFTAHVLPRLALTRHASPGPARPLQLISYRSALDAMPVNALTLAIASMFARR